MKLMNISMTGALIASVGVVRIVNAQAVYFSRGFTTTMYSSTLSGTSWSTPASIVTLPNEAKWVQAAICPTRNEIAVGTSDYDSRICVTFHINGAWGSSQTMVANSSFTTMRKFSVAYEQVSGDCLVAYSTGAANTCASRTGSSGTLGSAVTAQTSNTYIDLVRLYAKPGSDEVLLLTADGSKDLRASIWNGSAWGSATMLTASLPSSRYECFDGTYQRSNGTALVVYGEADQVRPRYRKYDSSGWSSATNMGPCSDDPYWIRLAARPGSDHVVCAIIDDSKKLYLYFWNGSSWGDPLQAASDTRYDDRRSMDVAWEPDGSHALVVYNDSSNTPRYRTWNGTSWSGASSLSNMGDRPQFIALTPRGTGNEIVVLASDEASHLHAWVWNGSTMSAMATVETLLGGENNTEQFHFPAGATTTPTVTLTSWKEVTGEE